MKKISTQIIKNLILENERPSHQSEKNLLAIDYGIKHCGLAFSPDGICVIPLQVIDTESLAEIIQDLTGAKKFQTIIFGLPLLPDGSENKLCQEIRKQGQILKKNYTVKYINERFSTKKTISSDNNRKDDLAAMNILEFYLAQKEKKPTISPR